MCSSHHITGHVCNTGKSPSEIREMNKPSFQIEIGSWGKPFNSHSFKTQFVNIHFVSGDGIIKHSAGSQGVYRLVTNVDQSSDKKNGG